MEGSVKTIILGFLIPTAFGGAGYGVKFYADNTYVRQDAWINEQRKQEARELRRELNKFKADTAGKELTPAEKAYKQGLEEDIQELKD